MRPTPLQLTETQLTAFIPWCELKFKVSEELLEIIPMRDTGADIFNALMEVLIEYNLSLKKLVCLATDGAPAMTGVLKRVIAKLKEKCEEQGKSYFRHFH